MTEPPANDLFNQQLAAYIRWGATALAGMFVQWGLIRSDQTAVAVSALVGLAMLGWSIWQKHSSERRTQVREAVAAQTAVEATVNKFSCVQDVASKDQPQGGARSKPVGWGQ